MNIDQWYEHPDRRRELQEVLELPCMSEAFELVTERGVPKPEVCPTEVDFMAWNALQNARREGYFAALKNIRDLSKPRASRKALPQPWDSEQTK